ncbi:flavin reductase family protein [Jannaschia sp. Os4]|uniref:flavin reductase family protein n=1 Tax=Jannaschia sp. Os4 TaxID=2807617 RepID=UPI00193ACC4E|nr:flavin reductase family protein [Jannaschia sp. Os4]MBM2576695.1 flavin reductase family protein [Jannaschia sp. Os4]
MDLRDAFLHAMSRCAQTVSVVATDGPAGRAGVTVSAMTSVSADAPTMLACVNRDGSAAAPILGNGRFAISVLREDQQALSDRFAGRGDHADRFEGVAWDVLETGAPCLDALANFDCELQSADLVGTHHVLIGAVRAVRVIEEGGPLIWGMRGYLRAERA